jgi:hypothetical protein
MAAAISLLLIFAAERISSDIGIVMVSIFPIIDSNTLFFKRKGTQYSAPETFQTHWKQGIFTESDAFLENGDKVMAPEIKAKLSIDDIESHIERMERLCAYADLHK